MSYDNIPQELKELDQWVLWRYEDRGGGKPTKVPYQAKDPTKRASSTDPTTWADFELAQLTKGDSDGLGFVLSPDDPYVGVDFDDCIVDGKVKPEIRKWLRELGSYGEVSPSGRGVRAFVMADIDTGFARQGVEVYAKGRFLTVTGQKITGLPDTIAAAQDVVEDLISAYSPEGQKEPLYKAPLKGGEKLGESQGRHASMISYLGKIAPTLETEAQVVAAARAYAAETQSPAYPDAVIRRQAEKAWKAWGAHGGEASAETVGDYLQVRLGNQITMRSIEFLWKPYLQRSAFHLLAGQKGAGKGTLLAYWAAQMSKGALAGPPRGTLWIKTEDSFEIDVVPRFVAAGGDLQLLHLVHRQVRLPDDLPYIELYAAENNIGMVIFDPLVGVVGATDTNDESSVVTAIGALNATADDLDTLIIGVRHLGKSIDKGALSAVLGGVAWVNTPRVVLGLAKEEDYAVLEVLAGNRTSDSMGWEFKMTRARVDGLEEEVTRVLSMGHADRTVDDIISTPKGSMKKKDAVRQLILDELDLYEQMSKEELLPKVIELGSSKSTLDKVMTEMKETGVIRWLPRPTDGSGQFLKGSRWYFTKAYSV